MNKDELGGKLFILGIEILLFIMSGVAYSTYVLGIPETCYDVCLAPLSLCIIFSIIIVSMLNL